MNLTVTGMPGTTDEPPRMAAWCLLLAAPVLFAILAVALGKDAGWDLRNYHWYNPFALFEGRLGFDVAPGHHATYYNPIADVPFYLLARHAPAWMAGAYLGLLFGVVAALIGAIAYHAVPLANTWRRLTLAALLALACALGGGALPAIGNTSNDVPTAIGFLAALLLFVRHPPWQLGRDHGSARTLLVAGILAGASVGLKLTNLIYAVGLCAATLAIMPNWRRRLTAVAWLGGGLAIGFALFGGYWMLRMWQYGQNPVFPYFNQFFQSPLLIAGSYRDPTYLPKDALTAWLFPFLFTADSHYAAEWDFRDARIAALYVLLPLTALIMWRQPHRHGPIMTRTAVFLFVFAGATYLVWLRLFSIYRYLVPLEMLAPLLIVVAFMCWPLSLKKRLVAAASVLLVLQALVRVDLERLPWKGSYVDVDPPRLNDPEHSMVLMTGYAPMAYVIPAFPREVPFLRIDGWLVPGDEYNGGLAREMHARIDAHAGPLYLLYVDDEGDRVLMTLRRFGLKADRRQCAQVWSNVGEPLNFCSIQRLPESGNTSHCITQKLNPMATIEPAASASTGNSRNRCEPTRHAANTA